MGVGAKLPAVDLNGKAVAISCGVSYTCALMEGGVVKCWGQNDYGQLGYSDTSQRGDGGGEMGASTRCPHEPLVVYLPAVDLDGTALRIVSGDLHTCALLVRGVVKCWGHNEEGQLGYGDAGGFAKCWGQNAWGNLGYGDSLQRGDQESEMGALLPAIELGSAVASCVPSNSDIH
ncbi:regulator of chromosome condensation 1/beta-lactamase-inhibitor protein II [Baffinella frigidus]|nr:regulator of chromosome condensation 1/beta-lactamase-inhibitor protein II [Cryptophyta sp. CCMP2293]